MDFRQYISDDGAMRLVGETEVSENLRYHLENKIPLFENVFRVTSKAYSDLIREVRSLYEKDLIALNDEDAEMVETDIGETAEYHGRVVHLDVPVRVIPRIDEAEYKGKKVATGKPFRTPGESKKFAVYVKTPSGNIKRVRFGDPNLKIKNNSPARAKSFRARHKCSEKKDRTKAGYWACRIGRYAKSVGLSSSRPW
ncbi:MAG: hypothetical protein EBU90_30640 [Proteobacteria bacterium]|nr:hypothetical protein [Pseudomonadota bacterium]